MQSRYDPVAVNKAIAQSRKPISRKEARLIHALLKGHTAPSITPKTTSK